MRRIYFLICLLLIGTTVGDSVATVKAQTSDSSPGQSGETKQTHPIEFEKIVLDGQIGKVCYAVTAADVDGDGRLDAVAISEREAVWFRNPDWKKFTMISDAVPKDHVCIAPADIDRDGKIDFALGAGWPRNGGTIHWMRRGDSLDQPWQVYPISSEPWTHRMRWADVLGSGQKQLVVSPLNKTQGEGVRLLVFPVPADPMTDRWTPTVMDATLDRVHNHWHIASEQGPEQTLVASQQGLNLIRRTPVGFSKIRLDAGNVSEEPNQRGAGEVKTGQLGGQQLLATIEPMHGHQVVVYTGKTIGPGMARRVIDDTFVQGHAVWCCDLDGDGSDEVVAGHRDAHSGQQPGIYVYRFDANRPTTGKEATPGGREWIRQELDAPMACEDVWCDDFDGDGKIDVLAGGRATHDVNLYLNRTH